MGSSRQRRLARSLPFYYGWVILAVSSLTSFSANPVMSVTTLSVFVLPMTEHFGWSRGLFSGAASLGGLCAVAVSPFVGRWIDRKGSGVVMAVTSAVAGVCAIGLSMTTQAWMFYAFYVPGRMSFASPLELSTSTALSNWFIRRRALAQALFSITQGTGLAAMPLAAQLILGAWDWRVAWASLGIFTVSIAVLPPLLLVGRRPEDMGLEADPGGERSRQAASGRSGTGTAAAFAPVEINFTVCEALRTRAFWILAVFSAVGFMGQAGVNLHQVPHYVGQGLSPASAAVIPSAFAFPMVLGGLVWAPLARRVPVRLLLSVSGFSVALGALGTGMSGSLGWGMAASIALGFGVGGLLLLFRLAWANYYGRRHLGSIRGLTLPVQIAGQAMGPIISGFMYDATGSYRAAFFGFAAVVCLAALFVLAATPPQKQAGQSREG